MFFIFGIANGNKQLNFVQTMLCSRCGNFGRFEVYMTYMYFSLFFIPVFHWGKRYFVKSTCCGTVYEINGELGKRLQRGENVNLTEADLHTVNDTGDRKGTACPSCGYPISEDFEFCPKCGKRLL